MPWGGHRFRVRGATGQVALLGARPVPGGVGAGSRPVVMGAPSRPPRAPQAASSWGVCPGRQLLVPEQGFVGVGSHRELVLRVTGGVRRS